MEFIMRQVARDSKCWVDLFETNFFGGKLRRLSGPRKMRKVNAKSLIVGPRTTVMLSLRRKGKEMVIKLDPKCVIPDLGRSIKGAVIHRAEVCAK